MTTDPVLVCPLLLASRSQVPVRPELEELLSPLPPLPPVPPVPVVVDEPHPATAKERQTSERIKAELTRISLARAYARALEPVTTKPSPDRFTAGISFATGRS